MNICFILILLFFFKCPDKVVSQTSGALSTTALSPAELAYLQNALLCQRRLSFPVPFFRVLVPGLSTESAIFQGTNFSTANIGNLVTNALNLGIRRLEIPLFFDTFTKNFGLCPVSYSVTPYASSINDIQVIDPRNNSVIYTCPQPGSSLASLLQPLLSWCQSNNDINYRDILVIVFDLKLAAVDTSSSSSVTPAPTSTTESSTNSVSTTLLTSSNTISDTTTATVNYTDTANTTVPTTTTLAILSSTATATTASPTAVPATTPLYASMNQLFGSMQYTPANLISERANLNNSWLTINGLKGTTTDMYLMVFPYYDVTKVYPGNSSEFYYSSTNGWPALQYLLMLNSRVLVGFGTVENGVSAVYNLTVDAPYIFQAANLSGIAPLNLHEMTFPTDSCNAPNYDVYMEPTGIETYPGAIPYTPGMQEVSWGFDYVASAPDAYSYIESAEIVTCGFQPQYAVNFSALAISSTVWSWDSMQPDSNSSKRCAIVTQNSPRWSNVQCDLTYPIACKSILDPFNWTLGLEQAYIYYQAGSDLYNVCPDDYYFGVPMTPQENNALYSMIIEKKQQVVWINYNSIRAQNCWVFGTDPCPDVDGSVTLSTVLASTYKEAIGVVCVFVIFVFLKSRQQYQTSLSNKRMSEARRLKSIGEYKSIAA